jgi:mercuric ion binding protein
MERSLIFSAALLSLGGFGTVVMTTTSPGAAEPTSVQMAIAQTTTFAIQNMTCALCPVTVRKAIEGVNGVTSVKVDLDAKTVTVVFDPSTTNQDAIATASADAGYPASVKG